MHQTDNHLVGKSLDHSLLFFCQSLRAEVTTGIMARRLNVPRHGRLIEDLWEHRSVRRLYGLGSGSTGRIYSLSRARRPWDTLLWLTPTDRARILRRKAA
jgi:hypothetical protein